MRSHIMGVLPDNGLHEVVRFYWFGDDKTGGPSHEVVRLPIIGWAVSCLDEQGDPDVGWLQKYPLTADGSEDGAADRANNCLQAIAVKATGIIFTHDTSFPSEEGFVEWATTAMKEEEAACAKREARQRRKALGG